MTVERNRLTIPDEICILYYVLCDNNKYLISVTCNISNASETDLTNGKRVKSILKSSFEFLIDNHMIPLKEKKMTSPKNF